MVSLSREEPTNKIVIEGFRINMPKTINLFKARMVLNDLTEGRDYDEELKELLWFISCDDNGNLMFDDEDALKHSVDGGVITIEDLRDEIEQEVIGQIRAFLKTTHFELACSKIQWPYGFFNVVHLETKQGSKYV